MTLRWSDGGPAKNRDGLNTGSSDSVWARASRYHYESLRWHENAEALWGVDADVYEQFSYHPTPLNTVRFECEEIEFGPRVNRKRKKAISRLKRQLLELVRQQDAMWAAEWSETHEAEWAAIEEAIREIKQRLLYDFDVYVEAGSNSKGR